MKSMTGFSFLEFSSEYWDLKIDLKSYNNRFLELYVNLPQHVSSFEPLIRKKLNLFIKRGRIELSLFIKDKGDVQALHINEGLVLSLIQRFSHITRGVSVNINYNVSDFFKIEGCTYNLYTDSQLKLLWEFIDESIEKSLENFNTTRINEGAVLKKSIKSYLENIINDLKIIEDSRTEITDKLRENFLGKYKELSSNIDFSEERMSMELGILISKYSIEEEIIRLRAHVNSFLELIEIEDDSIGKKADFLCQELNREINTISSKNLLLKISQNVISIKNNIENIREQMRNIE